MDGLRKSRVIICDLWNYFAYADVRQDIPLFPGDVVVVPERLPDVDQPEHSEDLEEPEDLEDPEDP